MKVLLTDKRILDIIWLHSSNTLMLNYDSTMLTQLDIEAISKVLALTGLQVVEVHKIK